MKTTSSYDTQELQTPPQFLQDYPQDYSLIASPDFPEDSYELGDQSRWQSLQNPYSEPANYDLTLHRLMPDELYNLNIAGWVPFYSAAELKRFYPAGNIPLAFQQAYPPVFAVESENETVPTAIMKGYIPPSVAIADDFDITIATAHRFDDYTRLFVSTLPIDADGNSLPSPQTVTPGESITYYLRNVVALPFGLETGFDIRCDYHRDGDVDVVDMTFIPGTAVGSLITAREFHAKLMVSPHVSGGSLVICEINFNINVLGGHLPIDAIVKSMLVDSTKEYCQDLLMSLTLRADGRDPTEYMKIIGE